MINDENYRYFVAVGNQREEAVTLHIQRYREVGFFKVGENDPYEPDSVYFGVSALNDPTIVGVTRIIFASKIEELPTMKHFNLFDLERRKALQLNHRTIVEMGAFTKMPKHDVGLGLIRIALQYSFANGISHWICCLDERVYNYMHRIFKFPFRIVGEPDVYLGSNTIPCLLDLAECIESTRINRPAIYDYFGIFLTNTNREAVK